LGIEHPASIDIIVTTMSAIDIIRFVIIITSFLFVFYKVEEDNTCNCFSVATIDVYRLTRQEHEPPRIFLGGH
jgi:hypothetical protein